jgi:hypothetical protein
MRNLFLAAALLAFLTASPALAQQPPVSIYGGQVQPLGYVQCTSLGTATPITSTGSVCTGNIPAGAKYADIIFEAQSIRYRTDGVAPTSTVGMLMAAGTDKVFALNNFANMKFIQVTAGAVLDIEFFQ